MTRVTFVLIFEASMSDAKNMRQEGRGLMHPSVGSGQARRLAVIRFDIDIFVNQWDCLEQFIGGH